MATEEHNLVLDILEQLQEGQKAIKQTLRTELGSVRAELQIIQHTPGRPDCRLEAHIGIEDSPQH